MVGQRVGNYEIVQPLGEGGMATVYVALHPELQRRVAVKVLHADLARSREMVERFFNEARAASGIGHRGIVEISDLGTLESGEPYLVMELLEGESLANRMTSQGSFSLLAATEIAAQTADVMVAAHARGIVHRDLKPENLYLIADPLLPGRELVKVLDFGIAKLAQRLPEREGVRTRTGAILGTPRYMSPEQCRESRDVDHRADVYSLGVVLYEMLAGEPPFVSASWVELAHMHLVVDPPPLRSRVAATPAAIAKVVHRALEKDPAERFQSMAEFRSALLAAAATPATISASGRYAEAGSTKLFDAPAGKRRPTTLEEAAAEVVRPSPIKRRMIPLVAALGAAGALLMVGGWLALRPTATQPEAAVPEPAVPRAAGPALPAAAPPPTVETSPVAPPPVEAPAPIAEPALAAPAPSPARELAPPPAPDHEAPGASSGPPAAGQAPEQPHDAPAPPRRRRRSLAAPKPAAPPKATPPEKLPPTKTAPAAPPATRPAPRQPFKI